MRHAKGVIALCAPDDCQCDVHSLSSVFGLYQLQRKWRIFFSVETGICSELLKLLINLQRQNHMAGLTAKSDTFLVSHYLQFHLTRYEMLITPLRGFNIERVI